MNLPPPSSKSTFVEYHQLIGEKSQLHVEDSLKRSREEVRRFYGAVSESEIVDCLVSVDGTWQKRGHQSLLGAVYVIEYQTGKVLDCNFFCKFCHDCNLHKNWDKGADFLAWKESRGRNLMKANVNVILMVAQVLWSPWDLLRFSNVLWTISFSINTLFLVEITVL